MPTSSNTKAKPPAKAATGGTVSIALLARQPLASGEPERVTLKRLSARMADRVRPKAEGGNVVAIYDKASAKSDETLLMESVGTTSPDFLNGLMADAVEFTAHRRRDRGEVLEQAMSIIRGVKPRDEIEALLGTQMAAIHIATMTAAMRLAEAEDSRRYEVSLNAVNKLARTFTTQVEALKRHRSKGEQRVYVERVNVNEGGQAVIGNIDRGEG